MNISLALLQGLNGSLEESQSVNVDTSGPINPDSEPTKGDGQPTIEPLTPRFTAMPTGLFSP
ncbi:MAG: hypothetical protein P8J68_08365 [Arenicellaceae bacterium]|nr:hypothetical protein [Arenicellaceae bacterium]